MTRPHHPIRRPAALTALAISWLLTAAPSAASRRHLRSDRGDVPGWVMITMMTAIVVIALLTVFQDAVLTAVRNAFDSISGQAD